MAIRTHEQMAAFEKDFATRLGQGCYKGQRVGQAWVNLLSAHDAWLAQQLMYDLADDPFYDDRVLPRARARVAQILDNEENRI